MSASDEQDGTPRPTWTSLGASSRPSPGADARLTALAFVAAFGSVRSSSRCRTRGRSRRSTTVGHRRGSPRPGRPSARAYGALLTGLAREPGALSETLVAATVLILTGLAVTMPLRAGLFNIGGEGQVIAGGLAGGFVGFAVEGLPLVVHLPLAIGRSDARWRGRRLGAGALKARTGCARGHQHDHAEQHADLRR
jgi:ABC-type uncharacterized transport system permease subunit